jgi:PKD repeat protein
VYTYNEATPGLIDATGSYIPATNVTNSIPVGKGLWIYLGTATVNTANITIDVTGQPTLGNFSFNPSYTNSGNPADDGFNLLANPYPSAIDWLSPNWTKTNINNAIYIYQADNGQYASFVGGISTNGGSRFIASSQGFFIQTNGSSPVLNIQETAKTNSNPVLIKEEDPANVLRLKVNGDNVTDEMVIHLNENATENFDGSYDAKKIFSNDPSNPSISSINNNKDLSINCLPINGTSMSIPIRVTVGSNGMYNLSWNGIEGFTEGSCFVIEDLDNGNKTTLEKNGLYYFNAAVGFKAPRFIIHISSPLPKTVVEASCSNSQDGSITITNPSGIECMVQLKDANGNLIKEASINNTFTFDKLATGAYQLSYPNATLCGSMNQMLNISATNVVNSQFDASAKEIETNAVVTFKTNLSKSNNITWDFGDGTTATEVTTVNHQYKEVGTYNVTMTNQKGECSAAETMALNVVNVAGTANSMDIKQQNGVYYAVFNFTENTAVSIRLTNTAGQEVAALQQFEGKSGKVKISLDQFANGIYMIILNNGKESITKKIVK